MSAFRNGTVDEIGTSIETTLQDAIRPIFDGIIKLFVPVVQNLPEQLGDILEGARNKLQKPIKGLLAAIAKPLTAIINKSFTTGKKSKRNPQNALSKPEEGTSEADQTNFDVWVEGENQGRVVYEYNGQKRDLAKRIDELIKESDEAQNLAGVKQLVDEANAEWEARTTAANDLAKKPPAKETSPTARLRKPPRVGDRKKVVKAAANKKPGAKLNDNTPNAITKVRDAAKEKKCGSLFCDKKSSCFVAGTPVWMALPDQPIDPCDQTAAELGVQVARRTKTIETIEVGESVITYQIPISKENTLHEALLRYRVQMRHNRESGGQVDIVLLRDLDWIRANRVEPGIEIDLVMPEMGVSGAVRVLSIEPVTVAPTVGGRMVTGTFRHTSGEVGELRISGEPKPFGVTSSHPFWSVDRSSWTPVGSLRKAELVQVWQANTAFEYFELQRAIQTVYNIEVDEDHCYRIGASGILVHNASLPYKPVKIEKEKAGWSYAERAYDIRTNGKHACKNYICNLGSLAYKLGGDEDVSSLPADGSKVVFGTAIEHAEYKLFDSHFNRSLPNVLRNQGLAKSCTTIIEIFSERTPCPGCATILDTELPLYKQGADKPTLYYIVQYGDTNSELGKAYRDWFAPTNTTEK